MGNVAEEKDFYDVSIVDGYNLPLIVAPPDVFQTSTQIGLDEPENVGLLGIYASAPYMEAKSKSDPNPMVRLIIQSPWHTMLTVCLSNSKGCPKELQVVDGDNSGVGVVGCRSACEAFGLDQYCCSGDFANPTTCRPSSYSTIFKTACSRAYSYAFDDGTSTFTCKASDYTIIFCPNLASGYINLQFFLKMFEI
ncbi:hypothetical protein ACSBR2_025771 [Camellia fascicularis]